MRPPLTSILKPFGVQSSGFGSSTCSDCARQRGLGRGSDRWACATERVHRPHSREHNESRRGHDRGGQFQFRDSHGGKHSFGERRDNGGSVAVPVAMAVAALIDARRRGRGRDERGRRGEPAAREAVAEDVACAAQSARHAADRPAERLRGFRVRLAFEVAQHDGQAVAVREPREFLVDDGREFGRSGEPGERPASAAGVHSTP